MRDVNLSSIVFCVLFIVLTAPVGSMFGLSSEASNNLHYFISELFFWIATLVVCASATFGTFARQNRFALSQKHPLINRLFSLLLLASPFLALLWDVRFVFVLLGLLFFSHVRSKTLDESKIEFSKSRAWGNLILLILFTLSLMFMNMNGYYVTNIFDFGSVGDETAVTTDNIEGDENA